jgi:hypothetical protein
MIVIDCYTPKHNFIFERLYKKNLCLKWVVLTYARKGNNSDKVINIA